MAWIIRNVKMPELAWSNTWGWVEDDYDTYSDEERDTLDLPIEGSWERVLWEKQE